MTPNHRPAELAGGHLWRSPDPAPSQDQDEWVAQGFVQSQVGSKVSAENMCPSAERGRLSLGPYPKAKSSGCNSRTPGAARCPVSIPALQLLCTVTRADRDQEVPNAACGRAAALLPRLLIYPQDPAWQQQMAHCVHSV